MKESGQTSYAVQGGKQTQHTVWDVGGGRPIRNFQQFPGVLVFGRYEVEMIVDAPFDTSYRCQGTMMQHTGFSLCGGKGNGALPINASRRRILRGCLSGSRSLVVSIIRRCLFGPHCSIDPVYPLKLRSAFNDATVIDTHRTQNRRSREKRRLHECSVASSSPAPIVVRLCPVVTKQKEKRNNQPNHSNQ